MQRNRNVFLGAGNVSSNSSSTSSITLPLNAADIADGSVSNTEFQYLDGVSSGIQSQLNNKLPVYALLDEIGIVDLGNPEATGYLYSGGAAGGSIVSVDTLATQVATKRSFLATLCMGFTPTATGGQSVEFPIPYNPSTTGSSALTFNLRRVSARVASSSTGTSTFHVQVSSGAGVFTGFNIMASALSLAGSGTYEAMATVFASSGLVASGQKLRLNFSTISASHTAFTITVLMEQT